MSYVIDVASATYFFRVLYTAENTFHIRTFKIFVGSFDQGWNNQDGAHKVN
jgi:hypothetical protein